ncbi:ROK family protein [Motilibacter deserti]|uniref:ROK family protein n=1 Tax=Motilibacter deserti TaxID=2714956 RepID=A0ABX0GVM4_9ACTN|nr:ROK family protein [Motilibacter deserti]NHC13685.1 ROK family protein [Motilibacter deserti]
MAQALAPAAAPEEGYAREGVAAIVAVDVGGTTIKAAQVTPEGGLLTRRTVPTPHDGTPVADAVAGIVAELRTPSTESVGVGMPGLVDSRAGVVRFSANLNLRDAPIGAQLSERLGVPVAIEHDVRAACAAELRLGAGRRVEDLLCVVLGTGVAARSIIRGRLLDGSTGTAGELGHVCIDPGGEPCACGARGCVEVYASAAGVLRRFRTAGGDPSLDTPGVVAVLGRDPLADRVWADAVDALAAGIAAATLLTDPALVVLAGGLSGARDALAGPLARALQERLPWRQAPALEISALGADAGLLGSALAAADAAGWQERTRRWAPPGAQHPQDARLEDAP